MSQEKWQRDFEAGYTCLAFFPDGSFMDAQIIRRLNFGYYYVLQLPDLFQTLIVGHDQFG